MSCKYCEKPALYAVHHGIHNPPIMTCQKHISKGVEASMYFSGKFQTTVQDMAKYNLWKAEHFTKNYGTKIVKDTRYYITLVDTWLSGFKSILDAKPIRITFRYARREALTMVIPAKNWNNLKLAFLERPEIYKIDDAHLEGGATITHYINRHRAWYLDVWDVAKKMKFVFGPLHLDVYQGNMRIEPAPLGFEPDVKVENPYTGRVSPFKHGQINPNFETEVQSLLEKCLNAKPDYLCQSDFCHECGDRVSKIGSSNNQDVVCMKCFKKPDSKPDSKESVCAGCGNKQPSHATGTAVYCHVCWEALPCKVCGKWIGDSGTSYNGILYCKECYGKLTADEKLGPYSENDPSIPDPYCSECKGPLDSEAVTINAHPFCKICYDRFHNPEINYRCRGCGAIIPDKGKICNKCGPECVHCKTHQGPFKTIDHKLYCLPCVEQCKEFKNPGAIDTAQLMADSKEPIDKRSRDLRHCFECDGPLTETAVATPNCYTVCRECYDEKPNCVDCGKSDGPLVDKDESGLKVCKACYEKLLKCPTCGKPGGTCEECSRKDNKESNG